MANPCKPNNRERELWVMNDPTLYYLWKEAGINKAKFLKDYRVEIDRHIRKALNCPERELYGRTRSCSRKR